MIKTQKRARMNTDSLNQFCIANLDWLNLTFLWPTLFLPKPFSTIIQISIDMYAIVLLLFFLSTKSIYGAIIFN